MNKSIEETNEQLHLQLATVISERDALEARVLQLTGEINHQTRQMATEPAAAVNLQQTPLSTDADHIATATVDCWQQVLCSPFYIAHYFALHAELCSGVIVVAWRGLLPGPVVLHDGLPVLYALHVDPPGGFMKCEHEPVREAECSVAELQDYRRVNEIIDRHQSEWFESHSNLVAVRPVGIVIEFVVLCKGFVPVKEVPLPRVVDGVQTRVRSGWVEFTGTREMAQKCLGPGAGIGVGQGAILDLDTQQRMLNLRWEQLAAGTLQRMVQPTE